MLFLCPIYMSYCVFLNCKNLYIKINLNFNLVFFLFQLLKLRLLSTPGVPFFLV